MSADFDDHTPDDSIDPTPDQPVDQPLDAEATSRRRPVLRDRLALCVGLAFLAIAVAFGFGDLDDFETQVRVVWPVILLATGVGVLAQVATRRR